MPGPDEEEVVAETPPAEETPRRLVDRRGRVFVAPSEEAYRAALARRSRGGAPLFTADTREAAAARATRAEFGGRPLAAGAAATARGATLGLSDLAARGLGGEEAAAYLSQLEEANPEASAVGEVVGAVAPILAAGPLGGAAVAESTAGRGLLRGAVGLLGAPTRAVTGAAEALGGAAGRAVLGASRGVGRTVAAGATRLGLEGAVEGAAAEAGSMLSEAALGRDPDLTAEAVIARLGTGAVFGGAIGGAMGGVGGLATAGSRAGVEAASAVLGRGWRSTVGTELDPTVARAWALVADTGDESVPAIRRGMMPGPEGERFRRLIARGDAAYEDGALSVGESLGRMENANARVLRYWREGLRLGEVERLVDTGPLMDQARSARALATDLRARVDDLALNYRGIDVGARAADLRNRLNIRMVELDRAARRVDGGTTLTPEVARRTAAEMNNALNAMKRDVDALVARSRGMGPSAEALGGSVDAIRRNLEDAAVWGDDLAGTHREVNAAFTRFLTTRRRFVERFLESGGTLASRFDENPYESIPLPDSRRIVGFMREIGTVANGTAETTFRETTESAAQLLDIMERRLALDPEARAAAVEARTAYRSMREAYDLAATEARQLNQWRLLEGNRSLGRAIVGGAIGTAMGGPLAGLAITALTNPGQVIRGLGLIERWASGTTRDISTGVRRFITAGRPAAAEGGRRVRAAAIAGSVRAYLDRIERLEEESASATTAATTLGRAVEGMETAPRTRDAMLRTAVRANSYLRSIRPRSGDLPGEVVPGRRPPSSEDIERFMRAAQAVDDPLSVIEGMADGDISPDAVQALRMVYPALYEQMRSEVLQQVAEGVDLPHDRLLTLGTLLDVPTTPSLHPDLVRAMQATYVMPPPPAATMRPARLAEGMSSGVESLERRRAGA